MKINRKHAEQVEMVLNRPTKTEKVEVLGEEKPSEFNGEMIIHRPRKKRDKLCHERTADKGNWSF